MTPGKIYFAQVRCDHSDLPVTEQDFVTLEQLGRASHVSADAVRAAGSKTVFYTPDSESKFAMTSNFLQPCGTFGGDQVTFVGAPTTQPTGSAGVRVFPSPVAPPVGGVHIEPQDFTRYIIPYTTSGSTAQIGGAVSSGAPYGITTRAVASSQDSHNADSTSFLFMAYFGAADGVVVEVDYATVVEYIPTKNSPGGIEALVQLPSSSSMDAIFSAAAVLSEARPAMIQQPGDLTIVSALRGGTQPTREALRVRNGIARTAVNASGRAYREGFWDFDWLKKGSFGDNARWDFTDGGGFDTTAGSRNQGGGGGGRRGRGERESAPCVAPSSAIALSSRYGPTTYAPAPFGGNG